MSDEITEAFAKAHETVGATVGYECRDCGKLFPQGRDARQHAFSEHDNPSGVKRIIND